MTSSKNLRLNSSHKDFEKDLDKESIQDDDSSLPLYEEEWDGWYEKGFIENQKAKKYKRNKRKPEQ